MKYKNYIWDFDGTIFDSYPHTLNCLFRVFEEGGVADKYDRDMCLRHLQFSFYSMRQYTGISDEDYDRFMKYEHIVGEDSLLPRVKPFDDAEAVLSAVVKRGGRNFLYTHRDLGAVRFLEEFGMRDLFCGFVTDEDGFPSKPAPDAVNSIISGFGLEPAETIMVGDREIDGMSGVNAGIDGALVNYQPYLPDGRSPADVSEMKYIAGSLTEFAEKMGIF
ncbi:MAG: hypothetical protein E7672_01470 [Ruminococcaceae bacterium]|nr:hypothetical protein [Oscillospiraceae bacterium]